MKYVSLVLILAACGTSKIVPIAGPQGPAGDSGAPGRNCDVAQTDKGARIICDDGTSVDISNGVWGQKGDSGPVGPTGQTGQMGQQGPQGPMGATGTIEYPVMPCPSLPGAYPEVLMCINSILYAVYDNSQPGQVHYTEVTPGNYTTTDGRSCNFTVVSACQIQ